MAPTCRVAGLPALEEGWVAADIVVGRPACPGVGCVVGLPALE